MWHSASAFSMEATALYACKNPCQYGCQNVLACGRNGGGPADEAVQICKSDRRSTIEENWLDNDFCGCYMCGHSYPNRFGMLGGGFWGAGVHIVRSCLHAPLESIPTWFDLRAGNCAQVAEIRSRGRRFSAIGFAGAAAIRVQSMRRGTSAVFIDSK